MKIHQTLTVFAVSCASIVVAQSSLPIIYANKDQVAIKAHSVRQENAWTIMPEYRPDIYETSSPSLTFYTDVDSISLNARSKYDIQNFIILLNGRDSAYTQVKFMPSRLEILKGAATYNQDDSRFTPSFTYQKNTSSELSDLRKKLNLDSIAGKGNELSQIFNLLHWVHRTIRHDGSSKNPEVRNALGIISACQKENRGVNCRMMAIVLNECYLAMGISSRYVTCMPKETEFDDCHVINAVFCKELKKWIWIDPTFAAYVMDENGQLLGIEEVRQRLIDNRPLILNADANWNRESLQTKEDYLENYMAKNLYRLECPVNSQFDTETSGLGKEIAYIELLPLDGIEQTPQHETQKNNETQITYQFYKTNNSQIFWASPESQEIIRKQ